MYKAVMLVMHRDGELGVVNVGNNTSYSRLSKKIKITDRHLKRSLDDSALILSTYVFKDTEKIKDSTYVFNKKGERNFFYRINLDSEEIPQAMLVNSASSLKESLQYITDRFDKGISGYTVKGFERVSEDEYLENIKLKEKLFLEAQADLI